ncbi:MAG: hypothetical protein ACN4GR_14520 [Arenicellales bacterium]
MQACSQVKTGAVGRIVDRVGGKPLTMNNNTNMSVIAIVVPLFGVHSGLLSSQAYAPENVEPYISPSDITAEFTMQTAEVIRVHRRAVSTLNGLAGEYGSSQAYMNGFHSHKRWRQLV